MGDASATYNGGPNPNDRPLISQIDQLIAGAISFDSPLTSDGGQQTIDWTFDPQAADLDWLKEGDTLELTWTAQINDGHGLQGAEQLTITIGGTNDLPTIDASTNPVPSVNCGDSSAQDIPPTTGTITFTDQDLGDDISFSVTGNATATYNGGNPQPIHLPSQPPLSSINSSPLAPSPSTHLSPPMADNKPSTGLSIHKPLISIG